MRPPILPKLTSKHFKNCFFLGCTITIYQLKETLIIINEELWETQKRQWSVLSHCQTYLPLVTEEDTVRIVGSSKNLSRFHLLLVFKKCLIQATPFVHLVYQNDIQNVWKLGIQKEKFTFRNLFVIQISGLHHYKAKLSKSFLLAVTYLATFQETPFAATIAAFMRALNCFWPCRRGGASR